MANSGKHTPYYELLDALGQVGCPICRLAERSAERYLDGLLYEAVLDPSVRERLRRSRGFCREHTTMLRRVPGRALGIALIYRDIIRDVMTTATAARQQKAPSLLDRLLHRRPHEAATDLATKRPCPACLNSAEAEGRHIDTLITYLSDDTLYTAYTQKEGLCLAHLLGAMERAADDAVAVQRLLGPQIERYSRLLHELDEFIRKRDHRFRHEPYGDEGDAWLRAMSAIAGGESMSARQRASANDSDHGDPGTGEQ